MKDNDMTDRDMRWLQALADGSEIKELKGGSASVIKNRLVRLRRRLGCKTTVALVAAAIRRGLVK